MDETETQLAPRMTQADADKMNIQLSEFFISRRKSLGMTQGDVGKQMMVGGQSSVSCLERNRTQWRLDQIASYCRATGLHTLTLSFEFAGEGVPHDSEG